MSVCKVNGCRREVYAMRYGYCSMHYQRFRKHSDPLGGGIFRGETESFLQSALTYASDECLLWPFSRDDFGYAKMSRDHKTIGVHRYITEKEYGPKPTEDHIACHSCGNGHLGCINRKHLRWGTRVDNINDSIDHGTDNFFGLGPINERAA